MIAASALNQVKAAHPLADFFAGRGVILKRHGAVLQGRCPSHNEQNGEALTVWPEENRWHCFGKCGAGGDVIEAVMRLDGVNFKAACERLGGTAAAVNSLPPRFFIPQPSSASPRAKPRFTTELMQAMLDAGQAVLEQPGLAEKIAATRGWQVPTIIALVKQAALGWHDGKLAFFFEHGLKVRWRDGAGERRFAWIYGGNELWRAEHIRPETRWIFITEGETDAISLVDAGLEADGQTAVVAVPGAAAWKAEWGERLRGRDVILCTDADGAGDKAAERIEMDLAGVAARVARINPRELFNHQEAAK